MLGCEIENQRERNGESKREKELCRISLNQFSRPLVTIQSKQNDADVSKPWNLAAILEFLFQPCLFRKRCGKNACK